MSNVVVVAAEKPGEGLGSRDPLGRHGYRDCHYEVGKLDTFDDDDDEGDVASCVLDEVVHSSEEATGNLFVQLVTQAGQELDVGSWHIW